MDFSRSDDDAAASLDFVQDSAYGGHGRVVNMRTSMRENLAAVQKR